MKKRKRVQENRRFWAQVFGGDTVENSFSDVATSTKTWQSSQKFLRKANFGELLHYLFSFTFFVIKGEQAFKKIMNKQNFLAIHKNEQLPFIKHKCNNSFLKTIYLFFSMELLTKPPVFLRKFFIPEKENLFITAAKPNASYRFAKPSAMRDFNGMKH